MKKRSRKKNHHYIGLILAILFAGMLCACGDKKPVEIIEEVTPPKEEGSLKEQMNIPDQKEFAYVTGAGAEKTAVADVVMPDVSSVGIYELEAVELTTDYMESICRMFFDAGEYKVLWPSYIYTKEELQEQFDAAFEEFDAWTDDSFQSEFLLMDVIDWGNRAENYQDEWDSYTVAKPGERLVLYPSPRIEDTKGFHEDTAENIFSAYQYVTAEGKIDDRDARIQFMYNSFDGCYHIRLYFDKDFRNGRVEYMKERATKMQMKNAYVYTEEEAAQMALEYVEMAGLTDMQLIHTSYLADYDYEMPDNSGYDAVLTGYRFTFGLYQNGMPMLYDAGYKGTVTVDIGLQGLEGMYIRSPYKIVSSMTEESELLSFDQINEALDTMITDNPDYYNIINEIEFGYVVESYENGNALVPAWRYMWLGTDFEDPLFTINAVDGSAIEGSTVNGNFVGKEHVWGIDTTYFPCDIFFSE